MSINNVIISGNLTRDPELRNTGSVDVLNIGIAVNDQVKNNQTGEWEDRANFFDCTIFGNRARALANILTKGMKVVIEGKLRWHQWQDKDTGDNRSKVTIIADNVELMQRQEGQNQAQQGNQTAPVKQNYQQPAPVMQNGYYAAPQAAQPVQFTQQSTVPMVQQPTVQPIQGQYQAATVYDAEIPF